MRLLKSVLLFFILMQTVYALPPAWKIIPDKSSLEFTAVQNNAPVSGKFTKFTGEIHFALDQLKDSSVKIVVDMSSLQTSYTDLTATLIMSEWFNIKVFPQAVFEAKKFTKVGANRYKAEGKLTIRNVTLPVTLFFSTEQSSPNDAKVTGSTTIKRTAFGVGQGEWSSVKEIQDEVKINFVVNAVKQ